MALFLLLFMALWFTLLFLVIRTVVRQSSEKNYYKKMIANPCDASVLAYIPKFNATYGFFSTLINMDKAVNHRNNLLRQSQGWDLIKESDKVSEDVKAQLKTAYLSNGVPVK